MLLGTTADNGAALTLVSLLLHVVLLLLQQLLLHCYCMVWYAGMPTEQNTTVTTAALTLAVTPVSQVPQL
jgi:hypothetical protein